MVNPLTTPGTQAPVQDLAQTLRILARYQSEGKAVRLLSDPSLASQTAPAFLEPLPDTSRAAADYGWQLRRRVATLMGVAGSLPPYMLEEAAQDTDSGFGHFIQVLENHLGQKLMRVVAEYQGLSTEAGLSARNLRQMAGIEAWDALADELTSGAFAPEGLFAARWKPGTHEAVKKLLKACLGESVRLTENVPGMVEVPDRDQSRLGCNARLGERAIGRRVRNDMNRIGIQVACDSVAQLRRWVPGNVAWQRLEKVLGVGLGRCFDVQVRVVLAEANTAGRRLGECRLGQSTVAGRSRRAISRVFETRMGYQGGQNEY